MFRRRKKNVEPNLVPALSKNQEKTLYYFTLLGTIVSTILAVISIILTYNISQTSTKVEKMDSLLTLMVIQNTKQNEQINRLSSIQETSLEFSNKLSAQIKSTKMQTSFLQQSYAPDISLESIAFLPSNMKQNENILEYHFKNIGERTLKNLHSKVLMFLPTKIIKDSIYYLSTFTPVITDGNTSDLKPNSSNFHYINFTSNDILDSIVVNSTIAIIVDYVDPLTNKKSIESFFYKNMIGLNKKLISIYASPKETRIMTNFIDTSSLFKRQLVKLKKKN